ncbi:PhzF family phenazine biosynthesis protein [uncultured Bradyrhizobium sp.]|uniref:PhzF family phenazine biosynthesis protein n=1 Tax=uncultured Bradyrhizobium sp. TaxID=199684 RepID=UPI0035CBFC56
MHAWIVDAFADDRRGGNPAAVLIAEGGFPPQRTMQKTARDLGVPTTAFIVPTANPSNYRIRWFTVEQELDICGHATLAGACYLYEVAGVAADRRLSFQSNSGQIYARGGGNQIFLNLPRMDAKVCEIPAGLEQALGATIRYCAKATDDFVVEVESEQQLEILKPDFAELKKIKCRGYAVTARSYADDRDFVTRFFAPSVGVNEDEVCVSAHCKLGPYWAEKLNKPWLLAVQLSPRGGRLSIGVTEDRVDIGGTAKIRGTASAAVAAE